MATPQSIVAYQEFGIHRSLITYCTNNHFAIDQEYLDCFDVYRLLNMPAQKFLERMHLGQFCWEHEKYDVIFKNTSRGKLMAKLQQNPDLTVVLSIRVPKTVFDIRPTVIVKEFFV